MEFAPAGLFPEAFDRQFVIHNGDDNRAILRNEGAANDENISG